MDDSRLCRNYYGVLLILMFQRTPVEFVMTIVAAWNLAMLCMGVMYLI